MLFRIFLELSNLEKLRVWTEEVSTNLVQYRMSFTVSQFFWFIAGGAELIVSQDTKAALVWENSQFGQLDESLHDPSMAVKQKNRLIGPAVASTTANTSRFPVSKDHSYCLT